MATFVCSVVFMLVALGIALYELRSRRTGRSVWGREEVGEDVVAGSG
jgi:uncharacterized membrane protein